MNLETEAARILGERYCNAELFGFADRWADVQRELISSTQPYKFLLGGNGAGKSSVGGYMTACYIEGVNPITGQIYQRRQPPVIYIAGTTEEKTEGILWPNVMRWIPSDSIVREDRSNRIVDFKSGVRLFRKSMNQGRRSFEGNECDWIWLDEEPEDEGVFLECQARLFRRLGQMLMTMTTAEGTVWLHQWMYSEDSYPMDRKAIISVPTYKNPYYFDCDKCGHPDRYHAPRGDGCARRGCFCKHFTNVDGARKLEIIKRQYRGIEYQIRVEGKHLLRTGRPVVDPEIAAARKKEYERTPVYGFLNPAGEFERCEDWFDPRAMIRLNELPQADHKYVCGMDVGGGNPLGDYHAAMFIDVETGEQVALVHTRSMDVRDFGSTMVPILRWFNDAYLVPEVNNHGLAAINRIRDLGYVQIYRRRVIDQTAPEMQDRIGFWTDKRSKYESVDLMTDFFANRLKIHDPLVYAELMHYCWLREAREGTHGIGNANSKGHDDVVTSMWLACRGLADLGWCGMVNAPPPEVAPPAPSLVDELFKDINSKESAVEMESDFEFDFEEEG